MEPPLPLDQNRQVGISIFPRREEIFVALPDLRLVARKRRRMRQALMRDRIQGRERRVALMIQNPLKLCRGLRASL